jgi:hypothetical protein
VGVIVGVVIGYVLGTRAGEQGWVELREAMKVISTSEEVRDLVAGSFAISKDLLGRGSGILAGALGASEAGGKLGRVA